MKNTKEGFVIPLLVVIIILIIGIWLYLFMKDEGAPQVSQTSVPSNANIKPLPFKEVAGMYSSQKIDEIGSHLATVLNAYQSSMTVNGFKQVSVAPAGAPTAVTYRSPETKVSLMYSLYYPDCPKDYVANYFQNLKVPKSASVQEKTAALAKIKKDLSCLGKVSLTPVK